MYTQEKLDALELLKSLGGLPKNNYDEGQPIRIKTEEPIIEEKIINKEEKIISKVKNKVLSFKKKSKRIENAGFIEIVEDLIKQGLTQQAIAEELKVSQTAIQNCIKINNLKYESKRNNKKRGQYVSKIIIDIEEVKKLLEEGKNRPEIAKILNINERTFYDYCKKHFGEMENKRYKYILEGKDELIKDLFYNKGMNKREIIKYLNCNESVFYRYIKYKNIILKNFL